MHTHYACLKLSMWICFIERMDVCVCVHEGCVCTVQWVRKPTAIREQSVTLQLQMSDSGRSTNQQRPSFIQLCGLNCGVTQFNTMLCLSIQPAPYTTKQVFLPSCVPTVFIIYIPQAPAITHPTGLVIWNLPAIFTFSSVEYYFEHAQTPVFQWPLQKQLFEMYSYFCQDIVDVKLFYFCY